MKRIFALLLSFSMLVGVCGCSGDKKDPLDTTANNATTVSSTEAPGENEKPVMKNDFKRAKSVTISRENADGEKESYTYEITWNGDVCTLTMTEYGSDPCLTEVSLEPDKNGLFVHRMPEETNEGAVNDVVLCTFDDSGRVSSYRTDLTFATKEEMTAVEYDENGWPTGDYTKLWDLKLDHTKMQFTRPYAGTASEEYSIRYYNVITIDKLGCVVKADELSVKTYSATGETEETLEENVETYTYDDDGNLLKCEMSSCTVEFTYTDETVHHTWERTVPLLCYDFSLVYTMPLFWNLK